MRVVSNTSPILNLAIIGRLYLLNSVFGQVLVPPAVLEELRPDEHLPGSEEIRAALAEGWLRVQEVNDLRLVSSLGRELDRGETEAIALALEVDADLLLLDGAGCQAGGPHAYASNHGRGGCSAACVARR